MSAASTAAPPAKPAAAANNKDSDDEDEVEQLQYKVRERKRTNEAVTMRRAWAPLSWAQQAANVATAA